MPTIYPFCVTAIDGQPVEMQSYQGKVLLIVNVASFCGYTRQYAGLEALYQTFRDQGFEILAFPCNQFGQQEPKENAEIAKFCQSKFEVSFSLMAKLDVNGELASPLWRWLTQADSDHPHGVKWNFTKFLIDRKGRLVMRFEPLVEPEELAHEIQVLVDAV